MKSFLLCISIIMSCSFSVSFADHHEETSDMQKPDMRPITIYEGLTVEEAQALAEEHGKEFRVVEEDGEPLPATMDYRPGRINAIVEDGVVVWVDVEGKDEMQKPDTRPMTINPSFSSKEEFEESEWSICESATDGTNMYMMEDSKVMWGTKMAAPEGTTPTWMCKNYVDGYMTLWESDKSRYKTLMRTMSPRDINVVDTVMQRYTDILSRYDSEAIQKNLEEKFLGLIDEQIFKISMMTPADASMNDADLKIYNMLSLLKLKVMALGNMQGDTSM